MFNRPEMIPSQRMIRQTPLERLEQMRATASNAQEAEELLRCLVVFQSPLIRKTIAAMAPPDMDEGTRRNAFMTLRYWSLVQKVTRHTYCIPESIKRLYPPSQELMARLLLYLRSHHPHEWTVTFIRYFWLDMTATLVWSLDHQPQVASHFAERIAYHYDRPRAAHVIPDWPCYLHLMLDAGQRLNDQHLQAFALEELGQQAFLDKDFATADHFFAQALTRYTQLGQRSKQASLQAMYGKIAQAEQRFSEARHFYNCALALFDPFLRDDQIESRSVLRALFRLEIEAKNVENARMALERLPILPGWQRALNLFLFGELLHKKGLYSEAQETFALALHHAAPSNRSRIYLAWAKMEYALGNTQAGCNLCRLALIHSSYLSEHHFQNEKEYWQEFVAIRTMLADMGCNEESQYE